MRKTAAEQVVMQHVTGVICVQREGQQNIHDTPRRLAATIPVGTSRAGAQSQPRR